MTADILTHVHEAAAKRILFLPHAVRQMPQPDRMITPAEVRAVVFEEGELIEDYPEDARGHSACCSASGANDGVCTPSVLPRLPRTTILRSSRRTCRRTTSGRLITAQGNRMVPGGRFM